MKSLTGMALGLYLSLFLALVYLMKSLTGLALGFYLSLLLLPQTVFSIHHF